MYLRAAAAAAASYRDRASDDSNGEIMCRSEARVSFSFSRFARLRTMRIYTSSGVFVVMILLLFFIVVEGHRLTISNRVIREEANKTGEETTTANGKHMRNPERANDRKETDRDQPFV